MSTAFINRETKSCWIHILLTCVYFFSPSKPKREFSINWTFSLFCGQGHMKIKK